MPLKLHVLITCVSQILIKSQVLIALESQVLIAARSKSIERSLLITELMKLFQSCNYNFFKLNHKTSLDLNAKGLIKLHYTGAFRRMIKIICTRSTIKLGEICQFWGMLSIWSTWMLDVVLSCLPRLTRSYNNYKIPCK